MSAGVAPGRVVVTGAGGQLGGALRAAFEAAGAAVVGLGRRPSPGVDQVVDLLDGEVVSRTIVGTGPEVVIHAAAWTDVDGCERDPAQADRVNHLGARRVAEAAHAVGAHLLMIRTDFVFPGGGGAPYAEDAEPRPLSVYGRTKLAGEEATRRVDPSFAGVRTAWLFGGPGTHFPRGVLTRIRDHGRIEVVSDEIGNPTSVADLAQAIMAVTGSRHGGVFHVTNTGAASRYVLAQEVAAAAGLDPATVVSTTKAAFLAAYPLPARRPDNSALANTRAAALGITLRPWQEAVRAYIPRLASELELAPALGRHAGTLTG